MQDYKKTRLPEYNMSKCMRKIFSNERDVTFLFSRVFLFFHSDVGLRQQTLTLKAVK